MRRVLAFVMLAGCSGEIVPSAPRAPGAPVGPTETGLPGLPLPGTGGAGGGDPTPPVPATNDPRIACDPATSALQPTAIHRLSKRQYLASVSAFFAPLASADRAALLAGAAAQLAQLPDDNATLGERNDSVLSQAHVDATFELVTALATSVAGNAAWANAMVRVCGTGATRASLATTACLNKVVDAWGARALRRPLTAEERADFAAFYTAVGATDGLAGLLARFMLHPRFFYELDFEGAAVSGTPGVDAVYALTPYELAHKLTYFFWEAPPDDALLAQVPTLSTDGLVDAVLQDARARQGVAEFYDFWLELAKVPQLPSLATPAFDTLAGADAVGQPGRHHRDDMLDEVRALGLHYTFDVAGRYEDLLQSPYSFAKGADLAKLYGVAPWSGQADQLVPFNPAEGRSGLLTQAALLVSGSEYTRPIIKGKRLRTRVLCDDMPPPPPGLMIKPLEQVVTKSTRTIVEEATASATCQGCHSRMNPLGFVTEGFDSLGRVRAAERKFNPDGTLAGTVPFTLGAPAMLFNDDTTPVSSPAELARHIVSTGKGAQCFVKQVFRFAQGRAEAPADGCVLERLRTTFTANGGTLKGLFADLVRQDSFTKRMVR